MLDTLVVTEHTPPVIGICTSDSLTPPANDSCVVSDSDHVHSMARAACHFRAADPLGTSPTLGSKSFICEYKRVR